MILLPSSEVTCQPWQEGHVHFVPQKWKLKQKRKCCVCVRAVLCVCVEAADTQQRTQGFNSGDCFSGGDYPSQCRALSAKARCNETRSRRVSPVQTAGLSAAADWGSKWRGRGSRRWHRGEERRGNRKRGAADGEMQESNQFNWRPCLKRRGLFSDRDPSQEVELQNRLIEVVKSSRWLILHNTQPRQPCEETPPRLSLTPAAECRTEPLLCVPSQTPSLAEQLEKYLPLIFFLPLCRWSVFDWAPLFASFYKEGSQRDRVATGRTSLEGSCGFLQNNKERLAAKKKKGAL